MGLKFFCKAKTVSGFFSLAKASEKKPETVFVTLFAIFVLFSIGGF